jgi:F-type H+-transporting ATPase subunit b
MEIFEQFGFDLRLFAAQIVNFLVIAFLFKRFLYKPILETLQKRNAVIKKGLKDAELATAALEKAEETKDELLKEAEMIIEEAKAQAQETRIKITEETKQEIARMMAETQDQIALERENFKKEAKDVSLEIARQILESALTTLFDKKEKDTLLKKSILQLKNDKQTKN